MMEKKKCFMENLLRMWRMEFPLGIAFTNHRELNAYDFYTLDNKNYFVCRCSCSCC